MTTTYAGTDNFPPAMALVDDGVPPTAAQVNPFLQGAADRTIWLQNRIGPIRLINIQSDRDVDATPGLKTQRARWVPSVVGTDAWTEPNTGTAAFTAGAAIKSGSDFVDLEYHGAIDIGLAAGTQLVAFRPVVTLIGPGGSTQMNLSPCQCFQSSFGDGSPSVVSTHSLRLKTRFTPVADATSLQVRLQAYFSSTDGAVPTLHARAIPTYAALNKDVAYFLTHYRIN